MDILKRHEVFEMEVLIVPFSFYTSDLSWSVPKFKLASGEVSASICGKLAKGILSYL